MLKADALPKPADSLLPGWAADFLRHFSTLIEMPVDEMDPQLQLPRPYWCPVLANSPAQKALLLRHLIELRIVGAHLQSKAEAALFFVWKKDQNIRMVVDARCANAMQRKPPPVFLGSPASISDLNLSDTALSLGGFGPLAQQPFSVAAADGNVRDAYYQYEIVQLGSWFTLALVVASEFNITRAWDDVSQSYVDVAGGALVYLAMDAMCMGWSWAAFFCQSGTVDAANQLRISRC